MKKVILSVVLATSAVALSVGTAGAGAPGVKGCVGASVSANAKLFQPYGKNFLSTIAPVNVFGTVGDAVQALQAGFIPDGEYANTCDG